MIARDTDAWPDTIDVQWLDVDDAGNELTIQGDLIVTQQTDLQSTATMSGAVLFEAGSPVANYVWTAVNGTGLGAWTAVTSLADILTTGTLTGDVTGTGGVVAGVLTIPTTISGDFLTTAGILLVWPNLDTDSTDDLTTAGVLAEWPSLDDFLTSAGILLVWPNLDTDSTDDFDGAWGSLTGVPALADVDALTSAGILLVWPNLDTDSTDDFDGAYSSLSGLPTLHDPVTLAGTPDYITITDQVLTRGAIDLATDVTGVLDEANIDGDIARDSELPVGANPTGTITGLGANGSATTFLRSDGVPPIGTTLTVADNFWMGLGASAGRVEFDDQTIDEFNILNARVGVGTSAPVALMDVSEARALATDADYNVIFQNVDDTGVSVAFGAKKPGGAGLRLAGFLTAMFDGAGNDDGKMIFKSSTDGALDLLVIDSDNGGAVGIGTSTPGTTLHIDQATRTPAAVAFDVWGRSNDTYAPVARFTAVETDAALTRSEVIFKTANNTIKSFVTGGATELYIQDQDNNDARLALHVAGNAGSVNALAVTSSGKVGIGNAAPTVPLDVTGAILGSSTITAGTAATFAQLTNAGDLNMQRSGGVVTQTMRTYSDTPAARPSILGYHARGTSAAPTASQSGDTLLLIAAGGYDTALATSAHISFEADGEFGTAGDTTDAPGRIVFGTSPDGAEVIAERMRITSGGLVGIGMTPTTALSLNGVFSIDDDGDGSAFTITEAADEATTLQPGGTAPLVLGSAAAGTDVHVGRFVKFLAGTTQFIAADGSVFFENQDDGGMTISPEDQLIIRPSGGAGVAIDMTEIGGAASFLVQLSSTASSSGFVIDHWDDPDSLQVFGVNGTGRITVLDQGDSPTTSTAVADWLAITMMATPETAGSTYYIPLYQ